jgi:hypothetical protein
MQVSEEENINAPAMPVQTDSNSQPTVAAVNKEKPNRTDRQRRSGRSNHSCAKLIGCFGLILIIVAACVGYLVIFIAGPVVRVVDELPSDFPKAIALYQLDQAKIKVQSTADKQKLLQLLTALPEWSLAPLSDYLTTDLRTQLAAGSGGFKDLPPAPTLSDLNKTLKREIDAETKTVSLNWKNINKTKQELFDYYKKQLQNSGFTVKDNLSDYEIDLSFFGPDIIGAMSFMDNFVKDGGSVVNLTVDYLSR